MIDCLVILKSKRCDGTPPKISQSHLGPMLCVASFPSVCTISRSHPPRCPGQAAWVYTILIAFNRGRGTWDRWIFGGGVGRANSSRGAPAGK